MGLDALRRSRTALLTSYRRNGQQVATPVSISLAGGRAYFVTRALLSALVTSPGAGTNGAPASSSRLLTPRRVCRTSLFPVRAYRSRVAAARRNSGTVITSSLLTRRIVSMGSGILDGRPGSRCATAGPLMSRIGRLEVRWLPASPVHVRRETLQLPGSGSANAPAPRRWTQRPGEDVPTAEKDWSVSSASWRNERPAAYCSTMNASTRACNVGSGRGLAVPENSGSGRSRGPGG
jgi:hypothetical protein